jgi:hypothetical protein
VPAPPAPDDASSQPEPLLLRLGPDDEQPFGTAQHWAAFDCTGA